MALCIEVALGAELPEQSKCLRPRLANAQDYWPERFASTENMGFTGNIAISKIEWMFKDVG